MLRLFVFAFALLLPAPATAQDLNTRFGVGFNGLLSTPDGLGIGVRARASAPLNSDLSLAFGAGFTGFVLEGRENATYVLDPQVSAIITFPARSARAPYVIAGIGAYLPLSDDEEARTGGPTIHGGLGWVRMLNETTFFYEFDPALIIATDRVHLALPFRLGLIF